MREPTIPAGPASVSQCFNGADLTPAEIEFGKAMERYRRVRRRPFPNCSETLAVLISLGYRKCAEPDAPIQ